MGLITKEIEITLISPIIKYYENLGYKIPRYKDKYGKESVKRGTKLIVKTNHLPNKSNKKVDIKCDHCKKILKNIVWQDYKKQVKEDGKYYCHKCAVHLYVSKNTVKTKLKNGKSFEQWCIENNKQDILNRWDYELNNCKPSEVTYSSGKKYYFKCLKNLHNSELKTICGIISGKGGVMQCKQCNSFAQWGIDNLGEDFLDKYWDWDKNNELGINPWKINRGTNKLKVWIKCQYNNVLFHKSYYVSPNNFIRGRRCPLCLKYKGEKEIIKYLKNFKNIIYDIQYTFNDLIGLGGGLLRFDFVIFKNKGQNKLLGLIEFDGQQHFKWIDSWMTKEEFKKLQYHDQLKNEYCKKHNIPLLRIPHWEFENIEKILVNYLKQFNY